MTQLPTRPDTLPTPAAVEAAILRLTEACGTDRSICPSEVARLLLPDPEARWQTLMGPVREAACRLSRAGQVDILRKGRPVAPETPKGVIRLRKASLGEAR